MGRGEKWFVHTETGRQPVREALGAAFDVYVARRHWFVIVDLCTEALFGVLGVFLAVVAALRPSNAVMDEIIAGGNAAVGVAACAAVVLNPYFGLHLCLAVRGE